MGRVSKAVSRGLDSTSGGTFFTLGRPAEEVEGGSDGHITIIV